MALDGEKAALEGRGHGGKQGAATVAEKAMKAMNSHSEAERRRERINSHLDTLRGLIPSNEKATLLGGVVRQVVQLRKNAKQAADGLLFPMDSDEVKVEQCSDKAVGDIVLFKASFCYEFRPHLLSAVRRALDALPLKIVRVEVSTLDTRLKNVIIFKPLLQESANHRHPLSSSVHYALKSRLDKNTADLTDFSPRATMIRPSKKCGVWLRPELSSRKQGPPSMKLLLLLFLTQQQINLRIKALCFPSFLWLLNDNFFYNGYGQIW